MTILLDILPISISVLALLLSVVIWLATQRQTQHSLRIQRTIAMWQAFEPTLRQWDSVRFGEQGQAEAFFSGDRVRFNAAYYILEMAHALENAELSARLEEIYAELTKTP